MLAGVVAFQYATMAGGGGALTVDEGTTETAVVALLLFVVAAGIWALAYNPAPGVLAIMGALIPGPTLIAAVWLLSQPVSPANRRRAQLRR